MVKSYAPFNWYWQRTDGQAYSSARQALVPVDDAEFVAWAADGTLPTAWPLDEAGKESDAELYAVLAPYGLKLPDFTPIPTSVTSAQAKIQCLRTPGSAGDKTLLDDITAAVQATGGEAQIWFTEARTWERNNPYVANLSSGLKLKPADVDQLFIAAAQIAA